MTGPALHATVDRIAALRDQEEGLRVRARLLELDPDPLSQEAARQLYDRATGLRKVRLALLDRCGLSR